MSAPTSHTLIGAAQIAEALGMPQPTTQQRAIIEHAPAPLLVVAGAGSGKTETMAARVVWLVANRHAEPDEVLGLTFTRKAAAELATRVTTRLRGLAEAGLWAPSDATDLHAATATISTYHAYAARLVREHALRMGREPDARLLSEAAAWQVAHDVVTSFDGPLEDLRRSDATITNAVVDLAGELAEHLVTPPALGAWLTSILDRIDHLMAQGSAPAEVKKLRESLAAKAALVPVLIRHAQVKRDLGAMDFADQMALAAALATRHQEVGRIERERFRAVLLDEFQDTSHAQLQLLAALFAPGGQPHAVTAVGDPHQSIYAWRGASAATLAQFPIAFGPPPQSASAPVPVLPLSVTWRNDRVVLEAANAVAGPLRADAAIPVEPLAPAPGAAAGRIDVERLATTAQEAAAVAAWIVARRADGAQSAAVLARKRSQFPEIVAALEEAGLPVEVVGLGGLLLTPEVEDVVALLTVAHDASRGDRLMRLLTGPVCRLGAADLSAFHAWARAHQGSAGRRGAASRGSDLSDAASDRVSLVEGLVDLAQVPLHDQSPGLSRVARERLSALGRAVAQVRSVTGAGIVELVSEAERAIGLDIEILARPGYPAGVARAHLDAFADVAADFAQTGDRPTLGGFLAWLDAALAEERGLDRGLLDIAPGAVHVLTVHAAKGLEWDAVAIPGLVEASFPAHSTNTTKYDPAREEWVSGEPTEGAWTVGLDGLPYDLRGDVESLPAFGWRSAADAKELDKRRVAFRAAAGRASIAEERRLAYVALTRARHAMLLTCAVWGSQKTPRAPSRFLTELRTTRPDLLRIAGWAADPPADAENPLLAQALSAPWPAPVPTVKELRIAAAVVEDALAADEPPVALDPHIEILLAERAARAAGAGSFTARSGAGGSWRALEVLDGHVTTSQLVDLATDPDAFTARIRRPMPTAPARATRRGTAFHSWLERHFRRAALLEPDELPGSADDPVPADGDLEELIARFRTSAWATREPVEVEVMVETVIGEAAVRGRIDAIFSDPDGGVTIVDWKSGHPPTGAAAHAAAVQLAAYRLAYARLRSLPLAQVRAAFYYAATGETIEPPLRSAGELEALVAILGS